MKIKIFQKKKNNSALQSTYAFSENLETCPRHLLGKILEKIYAQQSTKHNSFDDVEFKVFSQWGEDGIVQYLLWHINEVPHTFVEFGVENYKEANSRWLVEGHNWSGLVIDGNEKYVNDIKSDPIYWKHDLKAVCSFITAENIDGLIRKCGFSGPIGLLSIDIDGVDYWVWKAINCVQPCLVVVEYNSLFGPKKSVTVPYDAGFIRQKAHYSWSYYGASLAAVVSLGKAKGYAFVGSNTAGNNAFFVRRDLLKPPLRELTATEGYVQRKFREARDPQGRLAFPTFEEEARLISNLPLVDVGS